MEGPTPVSALIHAATMVAAGVFLVARVYPIFSFGAINGVTSSLTVVVWIGVITGLMAALIAVAQSDIKRILAYSTVSQLGLMMVSLGVGGVAAGIMHLLAHGFFKALLFLGAGSVIHGLHHEQDIRKMGGLRKLMPVTFADLRHRHDGAQRRAALFLRRLDEGRNSARDRALAVIARAVLPDADRRGSDRALHDAADDVRLFRQTRAARPTTRTKVPRVMTIPLIVLAVCTIAFSIVLTPAWPWLESYLTGHAAEFDSHLLIQPMILVSLVLVGAGIGSASGCIAAPAKSIHSNKAQPALFRFLENKMWIDEIYDHTVIALAALAARISDWMDRYVWDGLVRGCRRDRPIFGSAHHGRRRRRHQRRRR